VNGANFRPEPLLNFVDVMQLKSYESA
jgi:hypothetical protein